MIVIIRRRPFFTRLSRSYIGWREAGLSVRASLAAAWKVSICGTRLAQPWVPR